MTTVMVTGGLGFIGRYTVDLLTKQGYNVIIIDNLVGQIHRDKNIELNNKKGVEFYRYDIRWTNKMKELIRRSEYIIHLSAYTGSAQSFWEVKKYTSNNAVGTASIFDLLIKEKSLRKNIKKIIYASSSYVYGEGAYLCSEHGIVFPPHRSFESLKKQEWDLYCPYCQGKLKSIGADEFKPIQSPNPYSLSKYYGEKLSLQFGDVLDIPITVFRYFNVYGAGQSQFNPYTGVIISFANRIKSGKSPIVYEDGLMTRDFIDVRDIANANLYSLEKGHGIFNIGSGKPTSILRLAEMLCEKFGFKRGPELSNDSRPGDIRNIFSNSSKFIKEFGYSGFIDINEGLDDFVEFYQKVETKDNSSVAEWKRHHFF